MRGSRYWQTTKRTRRQVLWGATTAAFSGVIAACSGSDSSTLTRSSTAATAGSSAAPTSAAATAPPATVAVTAPAATAASTAPSSTAPPSTSPVPTEVAETAPAAATGGNFVAGQQLDVAFTYVAASTSRRVHNPYIAVWVEDADGTMVRTVGISVLLGKGLKWLRDLRQWYRADQGRIDAGGADTLETISSPTRQPGAWEFSWDGSNDVGQPVPLGSYKLFIEAAMEKGPYDLIEYDLVLDGKPFSAQPPASGQLQGVSVVLG